MTTPMSIPQRVDQVVGTLTEIREWRGSSNGVRLALSRCIATLGSISEEVLSDDKKKVRAKIVPRRKSQDHLGADVRPAPPRSFGGAGGDRPESGDDYNDWDRNGEDPPSDTEVEMDEGRF